MMHPVAITHVHKEGSSSPSAQVAGSRLAPHHAEVPSLDRVYLETRGVVKPLASLAAAAAVFRHQQRRQRRPGAKSGAVPRVCMAASVAEVDYDASRQQRILVVGGGIAGLNLALRLADMPWPQAGRRVPPQILLVDPRDRFMFTPLLVDYAVSGAVELDEFAPTYSALFGYAASEHTPLLPGRGHGDLRHLRGRVTRVDWRRRIAHFAPQALEGSEPEQRLRFDALVFAPGILGNTTAASPLSTSDALPLQSFASLEDGEALRAQLREGIFSGSSGATAPSVAVVGAGYVGVEVAVALKEVSPDSDVALFGSSVLRGAQEPNQRRARDSLERLAVSLKKGRVVGAEGTDLLWTPKDDGAGKETMRHTCDLVISTGVSAVRAVNCQLEPEFPVGPDGRIEVDSLMRAAPGIFCLGDAATTVDTASAATGQVAMQQAEVASWNVFAQLTGLPRPAWRRFEPSLLGEFIALGSQDAAAVLCPTELPKLLPAALPPAAAKALEVPGMLGKALPRGSSPPASVDLGGVTAAVLRRLSYLYRLPTLGHRAQVATRWADRAKEGAALPSTSFD